MQLEELIIKLGFDSSAVARGMRGVTDVVKDGAHKMRESFSELGAHIIGLFSTGAVIAGIERAFQKVKDLKTEAEALQVGTGFLQGIKGTAEKFGYGNERTAIVALQEMERNIGELANGTEEAKKKFAALGLSLKDFAGRDAEQSLYVISDKVRLLGDVSKQSAAAMDLFGRSGKEMVGLLASGSETIKKYIEEEQKLSDQEIENIEQARLAIREVGETAEILLSKVISSWSGFWQMLGELSVGGANLAKMQQEKAREYTEAWKKAVNARVDAQVDAEKKVAAAEIASANKLARTLEPIAERIRNLRKEAELFSGGWTPEDRPMLEEKIKQDNERIAGIKEQISQLDSDAVEKAKLQSDLAELELQKLKDEAALKKNISDSEEKNAAVNKAFLKAKNDLQKEYNSLKAQEKQHMRDKYAPDMDDLARYNTRHGAMARQIVYHTEAAKQAYAMGNVGLAKQHIEAIEGRDVIGGAMERDASGRMRWNPRHKNHVAGLNDMLNQAGFQVGDKTMEDLNKKMGELLDKAKGAGLRIEVQE